MEEKKEKKPKNIINTIVTIIVIILVIIGIMAIITAIFFRNDEQNNASIDELEKEMKEIYSDLTVYSSANKEILFLELNNWNNSYSEKLSKIINILKSKLNEEDFKSYKKFTTITHITNNDKENYLLLENTYNIPEFTEDTKKQYIVFEEYEDLYNTLNETMEGYTGLYNSYINNVQ